MSEPTKEELMARIAELEKQVGTKKSGELDFRGRGKGGRERLRVGALSGNPLLRTVDEAARCRRGPADFPAREQEPPQAPAADSAGC